VYCYHGEVVAKSFNKITMVASYSTAFLGFEDKRTKYITCIVLLFGSMSIEEHQLHVDSSDIYFSSVKLMEKQRKVFKFTPKNLFEPCNY